MKGATVLVIFGLAHREGEFEGRRYDNYVLSCMRDADTSKGEEGSIAEILKVSKTVFEESMVNVGDNVLPMYDKYGRIIKLVRN